MNQEFRDRAANTPLSREEAKSLLELLEERHDAASDTTIGDLAEATGLDPIQLDAVLSELRATKTQRRRIVLVTAGVAAAFAIGAMLAASLIYNNRAIAPQPGDPSHSGDIILLEAPQPDGESIE